MFPASILAMAINEATKAQHKRYRLGAVAFRRKTVLARGHNYSFQLRAPLDPCYTRFPHSVHAEVDSLLRARCDLDGAELLVVRITKAGLLRMAKPCSYCMAYIQHVGIKRVWYSDRDGEIRSIRL